jgi:hypothetical protein
MLNTVFIGLFIFLGIIIGILVLVAYSLHQRIKKLTTGTNGKNLEDAIYQLMEDHTIFQNRVETIEQTTGRLDAEMKGSIRGVATIRYNAFTDVGGKQSFATAIVSEDGSGAIISSVYARDRVNVYAKPILDFKSEYELSKEETQALKEASKNF